MSWIRRFVRGLHARPGLVAVAVVMLLLGLYVILMGRLTGFMSGDEGAHSIGVAWVARWTADGRYIFTVGGEPREERLYRYDTRTWEMVDYGRLPFRTFEDVSPEGELILSYSEGPGAFFSINPVTNKKTLVVTLSSRFCFVHDTKWVQRAVVLFVGGTRTGVVNVYKLSVPSGKLTELTSNYGGMFFAAADGSGFVYENRVDEKLHFYDLNTGKERAIVTKHLKYFRSYCYMYLSRDMLVYRKNTGPEHLAEVLDLRTLDVTRFSYCEPETYLSAGVMSPDFTMYVPQAGSSHFGGDRYVRDLPKEAVKILKRKQEELRRRALQERL